MVGGVGRRGGRSSIVVEQLQILRMAVTPDTFLCTIGVILLSGYNQLPSKKMYWEDSPDTTSPLVTRAIRRDTFEYVLFSTHLCDNQEAQDSDDRFFKVRPIFSLIYCQSQKYMPRSDCMSVDKMIIPYYGHHGDKQLI